MQGCADIFTMYGGNWPIRTDINAWEFDRNVYIDSCMNISITMHGWERFYRASSKS